MTARFLNTPAHQNVETDLSRRHFLKSAAGTALVATGLPTRGLANPSQKDRAISPESLVGRLYHSLSGEQKNIVCFDWDHQDPKGDCFGPLLQTTGILPPQKSTAIFIRWNNRP